MQIVVASDTIVPAIEAVKFPSLDATFSDGTCIKLPVASEENADGGSKMITPHASLICLSFRAHSQVCRIWFSIRVYMLNMSF